ncbi:MAG TPA: aminopeptidase P family protein, partial [Candidatus Paceibacterota bacterium]
LETHARHTTQDDKKLKVLSPQSFLKELTSVIQDNHPKKIGYDPRTTKVSFLNFLSKIKGAQWTPLEQLILKQREIKDSTEIELIQKACHITALAHKKIMPTLKAGMSEQKVMFGLEQIFQNYSSPKPAFETIVAFNEHSSFPHHVTETKKLTNNSVVLMDFGCSVGHYMSDFTRTTFFGNPTAEFKKIYDIVTEAQHAGIAAVREGVTAGNIDIACRKVIQKYGYGKYFIHTTGHGVGLDIHELPNISPLSKTILKAGMIITVEPGIYLPKKFGVRIEDTLLVTKNGFEILTK